MKEDEIFQHLDKINEDYTQKERHNKYYEIIDSEDIPFSVWLTYTQIDRDFVRKWLDRWSLIPERAIESIAKRKDYYFFYDELAKKGYFSYFLNCLLNKKELCRDDLDVLIGYLNRKEYRNEMKEYLKQVYEDYVYQKKFDWTYKKTSPPLAQLSFIKNVLHMLVNLYNHSKHNFVFSWIILLYDISVFNCTNYNKYLSCQNHYSFIHAIGQIHEMIFFPFLYHYCFSYNHFVIQTDYGSIDLIDGLITMYNSSFIRIGVQSMIHVFTDLFHHRYDRLNTLQKVNLLQCIHAQGDICSIEELSLPLLQRIYIDCTRLDDHLPYKTLIVKLLIGNIKVSKEILDNKRFLYTYIGDIFSSLDDLPVYCDAYEGFLSLDSRSEYEENMEICHCFLIYTKNLLDLLLDLLETQKAYSDSVVYLSELKKKLTDASIIHIQKMIESNTTYPHLEEKVPEYSKSGCVSVLCNILLFYRHIDLDRSLVNQCKMGIKQELLIDNSEMKRWLEQGKIIQIHEDTPLDAITMEPLIDPVTLPSSNMVVNRTTIKLHLYEHNMDPFTRVPFTEEQIDGFHEYSSNNSL